MKINDAKNKWCPFVRISGDSEHCLTTRGIIGYCNNTTPFCLANGCMAWEENEGNENKGKCKLLIKD